MPTERENYFRALLLLVEIGNKVQQELLEYHLDKKSQSLTDFINANQHVLYHLYSNEPCCQCSHSSKKMLSNRILHNKQMATIFDQTSKHLKHNGNRSKYCCSQANHCLRVTNFDITLLHCILKNLCHDLYWDSCLNNGIVNTLQNFLNENKHILFHIWKPNYRICCLGPSICAAKLTGTFNDNQWNTMFEKCAKTLCSYNNNDACAYVARHDLKTHELDSHIANVVLNNCCRMAKAIDRLVERRNELAHSTAAQLSDAEFQNLWSDCTTDILIIAQHYNAKTKFTSEIQVLQQRPFDETMFNQLHRDVVKELKDTLDMSQEISEIKQDVYKFRNDVIKEVMAIKEEVRFQYSVRNKSNITTAFKASAGFVSWMLSKITTLFSVDTQEQKRIDIEVSAAGDGRGRTIVREIDDRFPGDYFKCGPCDFNTTNFRDFLCHMNECPLRRKMVPKNDELKRKTVKVVLIGIDSKLEEQTLIESMQNRRLFDSENIEVFSEEKGSIVFWTKVSESVMNTKEKFLLTIDKFLQTLFSKKPLDDCKDSDVEVHIQIMEDIDEETNNEEDDIFKCGLCDEEMKTLKSFIVHKSILCKTIGTDDAKQLTMFKLQESSKMLFHNNVPEIQITKDGEDNRRGYEDHKQLDDTTTEASVTIFHENQCVLHAVPLKNKWQNRAMSYDSNDSGIVLPNQLSPHSSDDEKEPKQ